LLIHVVSKGEVLWQIAALYELDINDIVRVNGLTNPNLILDGQALLIPTTGVLYTVKYGDTMWDIAQRYKVPLIELLTLNKIVNPDLIYPGVSLIIPQKPRTAIEVNAYTYVFGENDIPILENTIDYLTYITPFSYIVDEEGRISSINDEQAIQFALANNVIPIMSMTNSSFNNEGTDIAHIILNDRKVMVSIIDNIIFTMKGKGYRGLNINFLNILPEDKEAFNNFLHLIVSKLHAEDFFVSTSLTIEFDESGNLLLVQDCESIGRILDYVIIMPNNFNKSNDSPKAISPIDKIKKMLDYVVTVIQKENILLVYQINAKDWVIPHEDGQLAETISIQTAMNRAYRNKTRIQYDETSQVPYFNYIDVQGRMHRVWFEDPRSAQAKFDIVKKYGLRGISYWVLGYPFPQNWNLLRDNFIIVKD